MKKKMIFLFLVVLCTTACSAIRLDNKNLTDSVKIVLNNKNKLYNVSLDGYKYYVPSGLRVIQKHDYNQTIKYKNTDLYLYVDVVSYYYNKKINYSDSKNIYYFHNLCYNGNSGYLAIKEVDKDKYFIQYTYNFAKIEAYVNSRDLKDAVVKMSYILSSIKYNKPVIRSFVGTNKLNYTEETFSLFGQKKNTGSFLKYVNEYDKYYNKNNKTNEDQIDVDIDNTDK